MVTWTFDLFALFVGIIIGTFIGAFIVMFTEMKDGGAWDKGFSDGFDFKRNLEDAKAVLQKVKEDK